MMHNLVQSAAMPPSNSLRVDPAFIGTTMGFGGLFENLRMGAYPR